MTLNYEKQGSGPAVILIHGFLEDLSMWNQIAPDGFTTYAFDLPGHGNSPIETYTKLDEIAHAIMHVIQDEGLTDYDVVGHSMGGYVALILKDLDTRCKKLVLMNSSFKADSEQKQEDRRRVADLVMDRKEFFLQQAIPGLFSQPELYRNAVDMLLIKANKMQPQSLAIASLAMSRRKDYSMLFQRFPGEIFFIQGLDDPLIPATMMKTEQEVLNFPYFELPASHMAWVELPDACRDLLIQILKD